LDAVRLKHVRVYEVERPNAPLRQAAVDLHERQMRSPAIGFQKASCTLGTHESSRCWRDRLRSSLGASFQTKMPKCLPARSGLCVDRLAGRLAFGILCLDALDLLAHALVAHLHLLETGARDIRRSRSFCGGLSSHAVFPDARASTMCELIVSL
jgi:hypothetical protein